MRVGILSTLAPLWEQPRFQVPVRSCWGATFWFFLPPGGHPGGPKGPTSCVFIVPATLFKGGEHSRALLFPPDGHPGGPKTTFPTFWKLPFWALWRKMATTMPELFSFFVILGGLRPDPEKGAKKELTKEGPMCRPHAYMHVS